MGNSGSTIKGSQNPAEGKVNSPEVCPVDHKARETWLEAARKTPSPGPEPTPPPPAAPQQLRSPTAEAEWLKWMKHNRTWMKHQVDASPATLATERVTSTIPRADLSPSTTTPDPRSLPSPEGSHAGTGNWIYPSEKMFFDAMKRKSFSPNEKDMSAIVPIHNAVNERAWSQIKEWESSSPRLQALNAPCGGPKLRSFSGDASKISPKARVMGWLGYQEPFDRHDWVVERCDGRAGVEYVIDFYKGRGDGLAFYLDVRPKLNSWEGWRMRVGNWVRLT
ncbi:MAG: hypothetical protein LQ348_004769 [Seirophora lacunosa]|nr:MAG: hypothetical protein LQ344_001741 [Seirophora lacunosa]KAI4182962.1 MAG: hypothetical protein LQ348_004769 [Seirophora lacunosa]